MLVGSGALVRPLSTTVGNSVGGEVASIGPLVGDDIGRGVGISVKDGIEGGETATKSLQPGFNKCPGMSEGIGRRGRFELNRVKRSHLGLVSNPLGGPSLRQIEFESSCWCILFGSGLQGHHSTMKAWRSP